MTTVLRFCKSHVVLCVARLAAAISACFVPPDAAYLGYFDLRTLSCLFLTLAVVAAILYFGLRPETLGASDGSDSSPTPTSAPTMPSLPTGGAFAGSINFASDRVSGVFAINESNWEGSTLVVDVTIAVEWGSLSYDFLAMDMASGDVIPSNLPAYPSDLSDGTLNAGEQVSGTVRFTKERGDTQVLLGDAGRSNLTMLAVKGP